MSPWSHNTVWGYNNNLPVVYNKKVLAEFPPADRAFYILWK